MTTSLYDEEWWKNVKSTHITNLSKAGVLLVDDLTPGTIPSLSAMDNVIRSAHRPDLTSRLAPEIKTEGLELTIPGPETVMPDKGLLSRFSWFNRTTKSGHPETKLDQDAENKESHRMDKRG